MQRTKVRDWCSWKLGGSPILLIAPHGGRRTGLSPASRRPLRVNDLYTAPLARELARTLDASFLVNTTLDRNELDLNRTSQVLRGAPWLLQVLESILEEILRRHPAAEVLFIHGWNVVQAKCDLGIGAALADEGEAREREALLTVSADYVETRLAPFRQLCARSDVEATYGERYPGRHRDNLLQVFRRAAATAGPSAIERLRGWARAGRVQAVQLELGVPLRWPGEGRERFLTAAREAFARQPVRSISPTICRNDLGRPLSSSALQFYDPHSGIGLMSSTFVSTDRRSFGSRLLLLLGDRGLALYVGEDPAAGSLPGRGRPLFERQGPILRLRFDGFMLAIEDPELYIDVERAFGASRLLRARADLSFHPDGGPRHGLVEGRLEIGGETAKLRAFGFADATLQQRPADLRRSALSLSASFGPGHAYLLRLGSGRDRALRLTSAGEEEHLPSAARVALAEDRSTPRSFEVRFDADDALFGEPLGRVSILRPLPGGRMARTTFGVARFHSRQREGGFGFYDYSRVVAPG